MKKLLLILVLFGLVASGCVKDKPAPVKIPLEERFIAVVSSLGDLKFKVNPKNITSFADGANSV